jgi:hypothetical protein
VMMANCSKIGAEPMPNYRKRTYRP